MTGEATNLATCYIPCFLLVVNSADVFQGGGGGGLFFLLIVINRFLITRFIFPSSRQKHPL